MTKHKHNWNYLMLFRMPSELEPNPKGFTHSKVCSICKKEFVYKAGKEWNKQTPYLQAVITFTKEHGKMTISQTNRTIYYK